MKGKWFLVCLLAIAMLIVSCGTAGTDFGNASSQKTEIEVVDLTLDNSYSIKRFVDEEAGVVCWTFRSGYGGGLSCLPLEDTNLDTWGGN